MSAPGLPLGSGFRHGCLRSLCEADVPGMLSWMHDPATARLFARDFMATTEGEARSFVRASWADPSNVHLAVADGRDAYRGTVSLKDVDAAAGTAEFAIAMAVDARGTGAALAGTRALLGLAFGGLGLREVWLCVRASNLRAIRFYEKVGFAPCDRRNDGPDLRFFAIGRDDMPPSDGGGASGGGAS